MATFYCLFISVWLQSFSEVKIFIFCLAALDLLLNRVLKMLVHGAQVTVASSSLYWLEGSGLCNMSSWTLSDSRGHIL